MSAHVLHRLQHLSDQVARINQRGAPADDEVAEVRVDRAAAGPIMRTFPISAVLEAVNFSSHTVSYCFRRLANLLLWDVGVTMNTSTGSLTSARAEVCVSKSETPGAGISLSRHAWLVL